MRNWNLFEGMEQLHREIDNVFRGVGFRPLTGYRSHGDGRLDASGYPRINMREDQDNLFVEALIPGVDPKQLDINLVGNTLTLGGERGNEVAEHGSTHRVWHRRERKPGRFLRTIELPSGICADKIKAEAKHGLLRVTLPKSPEAKPKRIAVAVND
ncbi:MAG: Hsp20/alpha crystallin family protein [Deltaproteobacteria bacterium]|jgi:HSP20 family protein|nr:Hsp20/alpha crystallin family protein [Deltaproteobacteria bacterium]